MGKILPRLFAVYKGADFVAVTVFHVLKSSPCDKKGIRPGDRLMQINGNEINDVLDYRFYITEPRLQIQR